MSDPNNLISIPIIENQQLVNGAYLLNFEKKFSFLPGQVIYLGCEDSNVVRIYSIASGIHDDVMKILYTVTMDGRLTPTLSKLGKDDFIKVSPPFGNFIIPPGPAICIASGTGIAPFASLFFSGFHLEKIIVHGSRNYEGFYFQTQLIQMKERYVRCSSAEPHSECFHGRVTDYLLTEKPFYKNIKYYLCGSAEMVVEVRDILIKNNVSFGNIPTEIYF